MHFQAWLAGWQARAFLRREIDELTSWIIFGFVRLPFPLVSSLHNISQLNCFCVCAPSVRTSSAPNEMIALGARAVIHQGVGPLDASPQQNASECMHGRMKLETILEGARLKSAAETTLFFLSTRPLAFGPHSSFSFICHPPSPRLKSTFSPFPTHLLLHYNKVPVCVLELRAPISSLIPPSSLACTPRVIIAISHLEGNSTLPVAPPLRRRVGISPAPQCITGWLPEAILSSRSRLHTLQSNFQA